MRQSCATVQQGEHFQIDHVNLAAQFRKGWGHGLKGNKK
jgi:hypothetical protein